MIKDNTIIVNSFTDYSLGLILLIVTYKSLRFLNILQQSEMKVSLIDEVFGIEYKCMMTAEEIELGNNDQTYLMEKINHLKTNANNTEENDEDLLSTVNNIEENSNESSGAFKWPNEAFLLLIEEYRKRADDFCSGNVSQKRTWQAVSDSLLKKGYSVTGNQ